MISRDKLIRNLDYNQDTGVFTWKIKPAKNVCIGDIAGHVDINGRVNIKIDGKYCKAHRLAWLYVYGSIPESIDHINNNPSDNRLLNLRACDKAQNSYNSKIKSTNKSGAKNVSWDKARNSWKVQIRFNNSRKILRVKDFELAELVAHEARLKYHGEYARHI